LSDTALKLYPLPVREIPGAAIYEDVELPRAKRHDPARPYVILNAVASVDGRATIGGRSSGIGSGTDRRAMRTLRSKVDAVMIGANTLRAEKLSLGLDEFSSGSQPMAVVMTTTGEVPLETNLIADDSQEVLVVIPQDTSGDKIDRLRGRAGVLRVPATPSGSANLQEALEALKAERGVEIVLVEGGPTLNHSLISQGFTDEIFLTLAPTLVGGTRPDALTILEGTVLPTSRIPELQLVSVCLFTSELYLRYRMSGPTR
jgi:2,5-diamino-6-(ribosylamino)-4(3H)-pyrimidinone 5'-phosphate reductase